MGHLETYLGRLEVHFAYLWVSRGTLGVSGVPIWPPLGVSGGPLGASGGPLGVSGGSLGAPGGPLGTSGGCQDFLRGLRTLKGGPQFFLGLFQKS